MVYDNDKSIMDHIISISRRNEYFRNPPIPQGS
jgi:hypothetical protein